MDRSDNVIFVLKKGPIFHFILKKGPAHIIGRLFDCYAYSSRASFYAVRSGDSRRVTQCAAASIASVKA